MQSDQVIQFCQDKEMNNETDPTIFSVAEKLSEWSLQQYIETFEAQAIDQETFVTITAETVKELIPIIGHRVKFLKNRVAFLQSRALKDPDELFCNLDDIGPLAETSSDSSIPILARTDEAPRNSTYGEKLKRLLQKTPKGEVLLRSIRLTPQDRKKICELIIDHLMITKKTLKSADWELWAKEITSVFPYEQAASYYTPYQPGPKKRLASGKLWDKYCNTRRYIRTKLSEVNSTNNDTRIELPDDVSNALVTLRAIGPQDEDLKRLWRLTSKNRKNDGSILDYYNQYPVLFSAIGSSLLEIDFEEAKLAEPNVLITTWAPIAMKIIRLAKSRGICEDFFKDQSTAETLGFVVLPYLFRTTRVPTKRGTNWRPSQPEVAEAFILEIAAPGDFERRVDERKNKLAKYGLTMQPFVLTVGSKTSFSAVYVVVDTVKYECSSLMGATDLCFKIIWSLNARYQTECETVWNFIQRFVYKIHDNSISDKNSQTILTVWSDMEGLDDSTV